MNFRIGGGFRLLNCLSSQVEIKKEIKLFKKEIRLIKKHFHDINTIIVSLHGGWGVRCKFLSDILSFVEMDIETEASLLNKYTEEAVRVLKPYTKKMDIELVGAAYCYYKEKEKIIPTFI